jgi:hypothetical protein
MQTITPLGTVISKARRALMERIEKTLDPQAPAYMVRGPEQMIDDGCEYDRGFDPRPEIVKEDDRARRSRRERGE